MNNKVVPSEGEPGVDQDRRRIITGLAGAAVLSILSPFARSAGVDYPFTLGVASGDPLPDGFVIWTRLAPRFNATDGSGGLSKPVPVRWRVASDAAMTRIVKRGEVLLTGVSPIRCTSRSPGWKPDGPTGISSKGSARKVRWDSHGPPRR